MGKLVVVYGTDSELEEGLGRLQGAGLGEEVRVVQRAPEGGAEAGGEADEVGPADDVTVPPAAALGAGASFGTPVPVAPLAAAARSDHGRGDRVGWSQSEIEDLTGSRGDEARHLHDVVAGGGALVVVDGDDGLLDTAERALAGHTGQGAVRR